MEILFGLVIVAVKLILEHMAVRHANKYSDTVVRRYNKMKVRKKDEFDGEVLRRRDQGGQQNFRG